MATGTGEVSLDELRELPDRLRTDGWSMAAALTRMAQPQPTLVGRIWQEVRRVLWSLQEGSDQLDAEGAALLERARAAGDGAPEPADDEQAPLVAVLRAALELDALGDELAAWAVDRSEERPDALAEASVRHVAGTLDDAGVPHEPRGGPPRGRGSRSG